MNAAFFLLGDSTVSKFRVNATYEGGTECSETSAHKSQTPGYHPKEIILI